MKIGVKQYYAIGFSNELERKIWKKLYRVWYQHNLFCYEPASERYYCYGAVGWKMCDDWSCYNPKGLLNFYSWGIQHIKTKEDLSLYFGKDLLDNGKKLIRPESSRWISNSENVRERNERYKEQSREIMRRVGRQNKGRKLIISEVDRKRRSEQMKKINACKDYKAEALKISATLKEYNRKRKLKLIQQ